MQSNSQARAKIQQAVIMLAGVLWLACDGESTPNAGAAAAAGSPGAISRAPDAGTSDAGGPSGSRRSLDESNAGGASSAPPGDDAGTADAAASGDAGSLPPSNDCCTESALPGCSNAPVLECVCAGDAACCDESYDGLCVTEAITRCALACEVPPPESDCTTASEVPSCTVGDIAECVCAIDPFCCTFRFDANCVVLAGAECIGAQPASEGAQP